MPLMALPKRLLSTDRHRASIPSRQPVPVSDHTHGQEMFPNAQTEPLLAQFCAIPILPSVPGSRTQLDILSGIEWSGLKMTLKIT